MHGKESGMAMKWAMIDAEDYNTHPTDVLVLNTHFKVGQALAEFESAHTALLSPSSTYEHYRATGMDLLREVHLMAHELKTRTPLIPAEEPAPREIHLPLFTLMAVFLAGVVLAWWALVIKR